VRSLTIGDPALVGTQSLTPPTLASTVAFWWATDLVASVSDAAAVSSWVDRANGVTVSNTSTARPTMRHSSIGGRPAVDFDGTDDHLELASALSSGDTQGSVFAVVKYDVTTNKVLWAQGLLSSISNYLYFSPHTGTNTPLLDFYNTSTIRTHRGSTALGTAARLIEVSSSGSAITMRVDGVVQTMTAVSGANDGRWFSGLSGANRWCIGALPYNNSHIGFFDGQIACLGRTSAALSSGDRAALHAWVTASYGIAVA